MSNIINTAKLDYATIRPYSRRIILTAIIIPLIYTLGTGTLITGISFTMCMAAIFSCYPFTISEKSGMDRLYEILPVSRRELVIGRYMFTCVLGLFMLTIASILHPLFLLAVKKSFAGPDIILSIFAGVVMFSIYNAFQLPGYYKCGSLHARFFMYIPLAGYFLIAFLLGDSPQRTAVLISAIEKYPAAAAVIALLLCGAAYLISIFLSIRFLEKKEL